ncbi:hypothetical protein GCM10022198_22460 [Klugiella xanthotipulae]|uniref:DNA modification methylase n=1 Tax=Klugiella xanthotipulae TaxID=244735 RepID=A0A543HYC7_9MICO|nr:hypothetical protein [Klugiella xanthotipulae]TQM63356.1 hypothetical protein FB466_1617 [Klugiella xanthotipulae]
MKARARIVSSAVLAVAVVLGTAGCNLISPQATTYKYDPSDGVSGNVGDIAIRNAILIAGEEDGVLNLVFSAVNSSESSKAITLTVQLVDDKLTETAPVATGLNRFGGEDEERVIFTNASAITGTVVNVYFQYGDMEGVELRVPVLDGTLAEYEPFVVRADTSDNETIIIQGEAGKVPVPLTDAETGADTAEDTAE